jgi:amidase
LISRPRPANVFGNIRRKQKKRRNNAIRRVPGAREETAAKALATKCRNLLAQGFRDFDLILTPAAPGAAPEGLESTGDPVFNRAWTLLGNPCLALPAGRAENGLPLAIQLVGRRGEDAEAIRAAAWIEAALAA